MYLIINFFKKLIFKIITYFHFLYKYEKVENLIIFIILTHIFRTFYNNVNYTISKTML